MDKVELLKDFEKQFTLMKKNLNFKTTLNELDDAFFIRDVVQRIGYIGSDFPKFVNARIIDGLMGWSDYFHGFVVPNPNHMVSITQNEILTEEQKQELTTIMSKIMPFVSRNLLAFLNKNEKDQALLIDDAFLLWEKTLAPKINEVATHVQKFWDEKANS